MITVKTNITDVLLPIAAKIEQLNPGGVLYGNVLRTVATSMLGVVRTRIHEQGKAADGGDIGTYSTKSTYISAKANPGKAFKPTGKVNKAGNQFAKFQSGKKEGQPHTSKYFAGGYKEFRGEIGRPNDKVNLSLSGQMNNQLSIIATDNGGYGLGWPNTEMYKRSQALEAKYKKKIWALMEEETTQAAGVAQNVINDALSE